MNILVTGAKGMVGTALCNNLKNIRDGKNKTRPALNIDIPAPELDDCESTDTVKAKRGRPKKKPDYDREKEIEALQQKVIDLFGDENSFVLKKI